MNKLILPILLIVFSIPSLAQIYFTENAHAEVHGHANKKSYTGQSDSLSGKLDIENRYFSFEINLKTLKTGINMRDNHMYKTLDVNQFPKATFEGKIESPINLNNSKPLNVILKGKFSIHGVSKDLEIPGIIIANGGNLEFAAEWTLNIEEYEIKAPKIFGLKVDPLHMLKVQGTLKQ